ncbi:uncharacterized protein CLUP02_10055 [Colletotrichum lupini]|uniref:Uncharacterized protein n=1 Tax=Colletotrichum lupini TaxID=145971 RepID=A0A9Q8SWM8_9PEZI|nr:uncharacterized protein CLUP02_10055 [Colletotrichum lupini]UQC84558.1 hypothetical protein CLUP02_10055 [Colletotrichum lupini]
MEETTANSQRVGGGKRIVLQRNAYRTRLCTQAMPTWCPSTLAGLANLSRRRRPSPVEAQTRLGRRRNLLRRGDGLCNSLGPLGAEDKAHGSMLGSSLQIASILPPRRARFPSHTSPTHQDSPPQAVLGLGSLVILVYYYCIRRKRPQHRFVNRLRLEDEEFDSVGHGMTVDGYLIPRYWGNGTTLASSDSFVPIYNGDRQYVSEIFLCVRSVRGL